MSRRKRWCLGVGLVGFSALLFGLGCQAFSNKMTKWKMLDQAAVEQPLQAVGGDGIVFGPKEADRPMSRSQLAAAAPQALVAYYTPIFIQQRIAIRRGSVSPGSRAALRSGRDASASASSIAAATRFDWTLCCRP
jgi:hypothetical protein